MKCNANIERIVGNDSQHKITKILAWAGIDRDVADPWYSGDFEQTYSDLVTGCSPFLSATLHRNEGVIRAGSD